MKRKRESLHINIDIYINILFRTNALHYIVTHHHPFYLSIRRSNRERAYFFVTHTMLFLWDKLKLQFKLKLMT